MIIHFWQGGLFHIIISTHCYRWFIEEVTDRYKDVDVALVHPVVGPHRQPDPIERNSLFHQLSLSFLKLT